MKLILTFAVFSALTFTAFGQKTYIPDSNFEEALIFEGLDTVLDDSITTSIIDTLTFLDLEPFGITDLTGIEDFIALKILVCRNNNIQQLDLSNNPQLEFLNCENNNISSLDVSNCGNLEQLLADDNNLTAVNFSQNPFLERLDLTQNGIGAINIAPNTALKILIMKNTSLSNIDLSFNTQLENLDLSTNQLSSLDLSNAPNLKTLVLNGNSLTQLDLSANTNLEIILASNNDFTDLDFQNNPALTYMSCAYNELQSVTLPPVNINSTANLGTLHNPDLYCIQSDNPSYVNANWNVVIDTFTVISDLCSAGINELEASVEIYPNPTENGWISVTSDFAGSYLLLDLNGGQLRVGEINQENNLLDFSEFASGIYLLNLQLNDQIITRRIEIF